MSRSCTACIQSCWSSASAARSSSGVIVAREATRARKAATASSGEGGRATRAAAANDAGCGGVARLHRLTADRAGGGLAGQQAVPERADRLVQRGPDGGCGRRGGAIHRALAMFVARQIGLGRRLRLARQRLDDLAEEARLPAGIRVAVTVAATSA